MTWGLRDYGTGEWAGGDPDCDHVQGRPGSGRADGIVDDRAQRNRDGAAALTSGVCGNCGATRVDQQLGLEPTPDEFVANMVAVFREIRRVLADHGTCWVNLGDSYHGGGYANHAVNGEEWLEAHGGDRRRSRQQDRINANPSLKPKDLVGIPWRVAFALQADGWYLRSDIVWAKPNPMPESVTDRPTKAHEYVFLLTKAPRYWFDAEAVREQFEARPQQRLTANVDMPLGPARVAAGVQQGNPQGGTHVNRFAVQSETLTGECGCHDAGCGRTFHADDCGCSCHAGPRRGPDGRHVTTVQAGNGSIQHRDGERWPNTGRNVRSVWQIATQSYPEAHFATFPEELARRCIWAGCPVRVCGVCGKPSERIVDVSPMEIDRSERTHALGHTRSSGTVTKPREAQTVGWTDCGCVYGLEPDALELVNSPTGERAGADPTMLTGRKGMNRPRGDNEGTRPIMRFQQRAIARQLRESPHRDAMEREAGEAFAHYLRTDSSGARPPRPQLLAAWVGRGWVTVPDLPPPKDGNWRPGQVLDPFVGSGTTAKVARDHQRHAIGIDLSADYLELAARRLQQLSLLT